MPVPTFVIGQKVMVSWLGTEETNTGRIVKVRPFLLKIYMHDTGGEVFVFDTTDGGQTWTEMNAIGSPVTISAM